MTDIGLPDPVEPEIDIIPTVEPVPGPVETPEPARLPDPEPDRVAA